MRATPTRGSTNSSSRLGLRAEGELDQVLDDEARGAKPTNPVTVREVELDAASIAELDPVAREVVPLQFRARRSALGRTCRP